MNKFIQPLKFTFLYDLISPIFQFLKALNWYLRRRKGSTPHLIKQNVVKSYAVKNNIHVLIETGTYLGTMVSSTKNIFRKIYTIELDKKLHDRAKNKFKKYHSIEVIHGDSGKMLAKVLRKIDQPCIFWLDAHYSKGITTKGFKETPILEELDCILRHQIKKHVILIDDAEEFKGKRGYPTLGSIKKHLFANSPGILFEVKHNIIRIIPGSVNQTGSI